MAKAKTTWYCEQDDHRSCPGHFADGPPCQCGCHMEPEFYRADGRVLCTVGICGKPYSRHPLAREHLDFQGQPWLRRLCNGDLVKL